MREVTGELWPNSIIRTTLQEKDNEPRPRRAGPVMYRESFVWGATAIFSETLYKEPGGGTPSRPNHLVMKWTLINHHHPFLLPRDSSLVTLSFPSDSFLVSFDSWSYCTLAQVISFRVLSIMWTLFVWIKLINIWLVFCQIRNNKSVIPSIFSYSENILSDVSFYTFYTLWLCMDLCLEWYKNKCCIISSFVTIVINTHTFKICTQWTTVIVPNEPIPLISIFKINDLCQYVNDND